MSLLKALAWQLVFSVCILRCCISYGCFCRLTLKLYYWLMQLNFIYKVLLNYDNCNDILQCTAVSKHFALQTISKKISKPQFILKLQSAVCTSVVVVVITKYLISFYIFLVFLHCNQSFVVHLLPLCSFCKVTFCFLI